MEYVSIEFKKQKVFKLELFQKKEKNRYVTKPTVIKHYSIKLNVKIQLLLFYYILKPNG